MAARREERLHEKYNLPYMFLLAKKGLTNDDVRGGKGHRILGNAAGSWFQNRRFRSRNVGRGTVERLLGAPKYLPIYTKFKCFSLKEFQW